MTNRRSMLRRAILLATWLSATGAVPNAAQAFDCIDRSGTCRVWGAGEVTIVSQLGMPGNGSLINGTMTWDANVVAALQDWAAAGSAIRLNIDVGGSAPNPCMRDFSGIFSRIPVQWSDTVCGEAFGVNTLAATLSWVEPDTYNAVFTPILFNTSFPWNAYDGPLRELSQEYLNDLRRVALHEIGHVLGLDHPDQASQSVTAIMNSLTSNLDRLSADDIAGIRALYPGADPPTPTHTRPPDGPTPTRTGTATATSTPTVDTSPDTPRIVISAGRVAAGSNVTVEVRLDTPARFPVAGFQVDFVLRNVQIGTMGTGRPDCRVNPAIRKQGTQFAFQPPGCDPQFNCSGLRALVLDLSNVDLIPSGVTAFTCYGRVDDLVTSYAIDCVSPGASTPEGASLDVDCQSFSASIDPPGDGADTNGDGQVDDFELLDYIDRWVRGDVGDFDLLDAIDAWARG